MEQQQISAKKMKAIYSVIPLCIGTIIPILIMVFLHHKWVKRYFIQ